MARSDHDEPGKGQQAAARSPKTLLLVYLPPVVGWLLLAPATAAARAAWGHSYVARPWFAMAALTATAALVGFVLHQSRTRGPGVRWLAAATATAAGLWLILAVLVGPLRRPIPDLYFGGGAVTCVFWSARRALLSAKGDQQVVGGSAAKLLEVLDGATLSKVKLEPTRLGAPIVTAGVEVNRGEQTVSDLRNKAEQIETVAGLRPGSVAFRGNEHDAGRATLQVTPVDTLAWPVLWTPDRPGESIALPIRAGAYVDGADCEIILPGDANAHRNLAHILVQGTTGAGKSESLCGFMTKVLCRVEVTVIGCDPVKGLQTLGLFVEEDALDLVALDPKLSRAMLNGVRRCIRDRGFWLGRQGLKQWQPGCGLTLLVVWLEEANWATQSAVLEQLAAEARSVGIMLIVSQQRASHTKTNTDLRSNLPGAICFGVKDAIDATFNLPDSVVDEGACPENWGSNKPGYAYTVHPSIDERYWATEMRYEYATTEQLRTALREWAHVRSPMDEVTRGAFGPNYDVIKKAMAAGGVLLAPSAVAGKPSKSLAELGEGELVDDEDWDGPDEEEDVDDPQSDDDGMPPLGPELEPGIVVDPDKEVGSPPPGVENLPFGTPAPGRKLSTEQARAVVQHHLRTLLDKGTDRVMPADLAAMRPPTTRSREWVRQELDRLCSDTAGAEIALRRDEDAPTPGVFLILAPSMAGAGR